jgi:hypothetical protein
MNRNITEKTDLHLLLTQSSFCRSSINLDKKISSNTNHTIVEIRQKKTSSTRMMDQYGISHIMPWSNHRRPVKCGSFFIVPLNLRELL